MASIGSADLLIVPKFNNFTAQVNGALGNASTSASAAGSKLGNATGGGFGKGLTASGAVIGAFSSITSAAMSAVSDHVGDAISRFDTLNNYPTVMQNLGYSAQEADESLAKMDEHLQGLPTAINDMASTVQGITAVTGDLSVATDASLALNDMLLASGSSTQLTSAAMEQFRQILAKGKPDMQDWKSLTSAMPGQMNQLAEAMLGAGATSNDLYTALGGGGAKAKVSTDQLLKAMVKLDTEGSGSMSSFADQAKTATGGVATSMANIGTAVTRGIAKVMDAVGKDTFSDAAKGATDAINSISTAIADLTSGSMPYIKGAVSVLSGFAPAIGATGAAYALMGANGSSAAKKLAKATGSVGDMFATAFGANRIRGMGNVTSGLSAMGSVASKVASNGFDKLCSAVEGFVTPANLASAAVVGITAAISIGATLWNDYQTKVANAQKATEGVADAVERSAGLDGYSSTLSNVGSSAGTAAKNLAELNESLAASVDTMNENTAEAESQISLLNTAQQVIDDCAGKTDLNAEAQGKLEWAIQQVNDQLGLNIDAQDVANNKYTDADGKVQNLKASIDELIESKKQEARVNAISDNLTEAYSEQTDAANSYKEALNNLNDYQSELNEKLETGAIDMNGPEYAAAQGELKRLQSEVDGTRESYEYWNGAVSDLEGQLGIASTATAGAITSFADLNNAFSGVDDAMAILSGSGVNLDEFAQKLSDTGMKADDFKDITTEDFQALVDSCGGNVDQMVQALGLYNATEIIDKEGNVDMNDAKLVDAQGNIYTWNGSKLVNKNGKAAVNDTKLMDAQGNVWTWNGSKLVNKNGKASINTSSLDNGKTKVDNWNAGGSSLLDKKGTVTIEGVISGATEVVKKFFHWRSGGIRTHASGGIRKHADGAIVNVPGTGFPLDMVGEDGAEAIVPLTNKRYSAPFAKTIAEQMQQLGGAAGTVINVSLNYSAGDDANQMARDIARALRRVTA